MFPGRRLRVAVALAIAILAPRNASAQSSLDLDGPEQLVIGQTGSAVFTVRADPPVQFYTNAGTIERLDDEGGRARARYLPPADQRPRVAIVVAATADFAAVDWVALRLVGRPTIRFSFEASSRVMVRVGATEYGPVQTDRRGRGEIQLEVPPGVQHALATGTDRMGNTIEQAIDLAPPPFPQVFALCGARAVEVFAVEPTGAPRVEAPVLAGPPSALGALRNVSPGHFVAPVRFETPLDTATVRAGLAPGESAAECELPLADPEGITLTLGDASGTEDERYVPVELRLVYPEASPRRRVRPALLAEGGELSELVGSEDGAYRARWSVHRQAAAELRASVPGLDLSAEASLGPERVHHSRFALEAQLGVAANFGKVLGPFAFVHGWVRLPPAGENHLLVGGGFGYVAAWDSSPDADGLEQVDLRLSGLPVLAQVGYARSMGRVELSLNLYGGVLLAFTSLESSSAGRALSTDITWALGGALGGAIALGPGLLGLNIGYLHAPLTGRVDGNAVGLTTTLSYQFRPSI